MVCCITVQLYIHIRVPTSLRQRFQVSHFIRTQPDNKNKNHHYYLSQVVAYHISGVKEKSNSCAFCVISFQYTMLFCVYLCYRGTYGFNCYLNVRYVASRNGRGRLLLFVV